MPRFLHTADWQIGRQYSRFSAEDAPILAEARLLGIERIAALATELAVDAVLVAGDVFDAQTVSERTLRRLFNALSGYAGPWLLLPGNHDAALAESVWTRATRLGLLADNVHLLLQPGVTELPAAGLAVLAAPLTQRHTHSDLTAWFDQAETAPGLLRIGLAHGSVQGILAEDLDSANPIAADRASRARLDYLALGDWHGYKCIDPRTWYSGTHEPERFRNNQAGWLLDVSIAAPGVVPAVEPRRIGRYDWQLWQVGLQVETDLEQLIERLQALPADTVLSLQLHGQIDLAAEQRLQQALNQAAARLRSLECEMDGLQLLPADSDLQALQVDGYLTPVVAELQRRQQQEQDGVAREALTLLAGLLRRQQEGA